MSPKSPIIREGLAICALGQGTCLSLTYGVFIIGIRSEGRHIETLEDPDVPVLPTWLNGAPDRGSLRSF